MLIFISKFLLQINTLLVVLVFPTGFGTKNYIRINYAKSIKFSILTIQLDLAFGGVQTPQ